MCAGKAIPAPPGGRVMGSTKALAWGRRARSCRGHLPAEARPPVIGGLLRAVRMNLVVSAEVIGRALLQ